MDRPDPNLGRTLAGTNFGAESTAIYRTGMHDAAHGGPRYVRDVDACERAIAQRRADAICPYSRFRLLASSPTIVAMDRSTAGIPDDPICAGCGVALREPFGWCSNCAAAFCDACAATHFCRPTCQATGCIAGLCVRQVSDGRLSLEWKAPPER